jgi:hypothetical protein
MRTRKLRRRFLCAGDWTRIGCSLETPRSNADEPGRQGRRWQVKIWYRCSCRTARPAAPREPSAPAAVMARSRRRTREGNAGIVFNDGGEHGDLAAKLDRRFGADAHPACRRADLLLRRSASAIDNRHALCDRRVGRPNPRARASHPRNRPGSSEPSRVALIRKLRTDGTSGLLGYAARAATAYGVAPLAPSRRCTSRSRRAAAARCRFSRLTRPSEARVRRAVGVR